MLQPLHVVDTKEVECNSTLFRELWRCFTRPWCRPEVAFSCANLVEWWRSSVRGDVRADSDPRQRPLFSKSVAHACSVEEGRQLSEGISLSPNWAVGLDPLRLNGTVWQQLRMGRGHGSPFEFRQRKVERWGSEWATRGMMAAPGVHPPHFMCTAALLSWTSAVSSTTRGGC